jgi:hypothetical protein
MPHDRGGPAMVLPSEGRHREASVLVAFGRVHVANKKRAARFESRPSCLGRIFS